MNRPGVTSHLVQLSILTDFSLVEGPPADVIL